MKNNFPLLSISFHLNPYRRNSVHGKANEDKKLSPLPQWHNSVQCKVSSQAEHLITKLMLFFCLCVKPVEWVNVLV